jgi:hypothetical protein
VNSLTKFYRILADLDLPKAGARRTPDYLLFADEHTKTGVFNEDLRVQYHAGIGLLEAKKLYTPLDAIFPGEKRFPHQQIRDYLNEATDQQGRPRSQTARQQTPTLRPRHSITRMSECRH